MEKSEKKQPMIRIRGANENNLKSVDLDIPRNQFIVFTGLFWFRKILSGVDTISGRGTEALYDVASSMPDSF